MYSCIVNFQANNESEFRKLLNSRLIHSYSLYENHAKIETRKLWKLYWLNSRFKKFNCEFSYSKVFKENVKFPKKFLKAYLITVERTNWFDVKITAHFKNVNEIWKILFTFYS